MVASPARDDRGSRTLIWCAGLVGILAVAVRVPGAIRDAFWEDEIASVHVLIQSTPWGMLHQVARTEGTPPLWYGLGWIADQFGLSPHGYRIVSVLAGGLLAAGTVIVARRLLPLWAAATSGLFVAFGWQFVMHGRELRAYELFALATLVFAEALLREVESASGSARRRYGLAAAVAFGSLTNYFFLLSTIAAVFWLSTEPGLRERRREILSAIVVGLIPLIVWSPIMVHQYLGHRFSWIGPFTVRGFLDTYFELFAHHVPSAGGVLLPLLLLMAVLGGCAVLARFSAAGRLVALLALVPVFLTAIAWLGGAHIYDPRNLIAVGPFAAVALLMLVAQIPRPAGYAAATASAALVIGAAAVAEATPPTPYNTIAGDLITQGWRPNDPILVLGTFGEFFAYRSPLEWYLPRQPYLTLGEPRSHARCGAIYVVAPSRAGRRGVTHSGLLGAHQTAGGVLVGRLRTREVPFSPLWAGSHILVARARPACVQLIAESRIIPELRG